MYFTSFLASLVGVPRAAVLAQQPAAAPGASRYHCAAEWKPGGKGGWDQLTLDSQAHRLYVARTDCVQVVDTESGALVRAIPGLDGGHGIALAAEFNCGFATSGQSNTVVVFDLTSLRSSRAPIMVGQKPAAIVYEPLTRHVFVCNDESKDVSVVDAATAAVIATIPLGGTPGFAVADGGGTVFVNLEDKNEILAIDAQENTVIHRWPLAPGTEPTGLALDPIKHRLFAGCRSGRMIVLDAQSGKHLAELPVGSEIAACAVDPGTGIAFASCGNGTLTLIQENPASPGEFRVVETVQMQRSAGTMAVDSKTHAIYLAAASFEPSTASTAGENPPRRAMVPERFVLLKFLR